VIKKNGIKASIPFLRNYKKGNHASMAHFFTLLLENPSAFPATPHLDQKNNLNDQLDKWGKEVQDIANDLFSKKKVNQPSIKKLYLGNITKEGFKLNREKVASAKIELKYQLPQMPSIAFECKKSNCFLTAPTSSSKKQTDLSILLQTITNDDPVQKKEIQRLLDDLQAYQKQPTSPLYKIKNNNLSEVIQILTKEKVEDHNKKHQLEKEILALANKNPNSGEALTQEQLKKWGGLKKVITLEEMIVSFARGDYLTLLQRNSALNEADIQSLFEKVGSFLLYATRDQQRTRAEAILSRLEKLNTNENAEEHANLVNQLAQEMLNERFYSPQERPAYLVFEYLANLSIRQVQVVKLEKFLKNGDLNLVMEMIMGSGKSKVLLPLLGLLRANGKDLSMLIVPSQLFESISQDTKSILHAFHQSLHSLHFDRHTKISKESLESILDDLINIQKNHECLIMTSKSVQCLVLKFIEKWVEHFNNSNEQTEFPKELQIMQNIINTLRQSGYPIIDEADTVLKVLHEISFSIGKHQSPKLHEISLLSEIYSLVYEDPKIKLLAKLESDPAPNPTAVELTTLHYHEKVKLPLASALIERLEYIVFDSVPLTEKMHAYIQKLDQTSRSHLMHYLCRDKDHLETSQHYYDSLDAEIQDVLALSGEQISHLLPHTLTRNDNENYGLDKESDGFLAIPFAASNKPNSGSEFSNPHITMNYTFQTYMKKGIEKEVIERQIKSLQEKAIREIADSGGKMSIKETFGGKLFNKLKGDLDMPLFNYKASHVKEIVKVINANPKAKRDFVSNILLPQMEYTEKKLSCNPQNLVALFNKISGFTGTLWNGFSMHHSLKPEPEVGTDAKTLSLLWENSKTNAILIKQGSTQEMIDQLKKQSVDCRMISDAGGYFKEGSNLEIARQIAGLKGTNVVFYNQKGEQAITDGKIEIPLIQSAKSAKERFTFLDQSHTTGADVPQEENAISLVTVGRNMLLRDLLQSVWRLRGLDKSQRVRFIISEEVAAIIRQTLKLNDDHPIQLEEILKFVIANQAAQQGRDNYKALKQELANIPQQILLNVLLNDKVTDIQRLQAFESLKSYWIKPAYLSSKELYGTLTTEKKSSFVIELDKKQCLAKIEEIFTLMPWLKEIGPSREKCLNEVDLIVNRIKDHLPLLLSIPSKECEDDQTVEVENEIQTETQTELEVTEFKYEENTVIGTVGKVELKKYDSFVEGAKALKVNVDLKIPGRFMNFKSPQELRKQFSSGAKWAAMNRVLINNNITAPVFSLKSYLEKDKHLSSYANAFDDIDLTMNVLEWTPGCDDFALLGKRRTPFHHMLDDGKKIILLSQVEAANQVNTPGYYNLTLANLNPHKKIPLDTKLKVAKIKFLQGISQFDADEINFLKQWFQVNGKSKMQTLYFEHILNGYPQKAARYQGSSLQKLFAE